MNALTNPFAHAAAIVRDRPAYDAAMAEISRINRERTAAIIGAIKDPDTRARLLASLEEPR